MKLLASVALALALVPSVAVAGDPSIDDGPARPRGALGLSLGATVAGLGAIAASDAVDSDALFGAGLAVAFAGPSAGHLYSHHWVSRGLVLRTVGAAATVGGLMWGFELCPPDSRDCRHSRVATGLVIGGLVALGTGVVDDIITAPRAARRRNARLRALSLAPVVAPHQAGLVLGGSF